MSLFFFSFFSSGYYSNKKYQIVCLAVTATFAPLQQTWRLQVFTEMGGEDLLSPDLSSRRWPQRRQLEDPQEVVEPWLPAALTPQPLATQTKVFPRREERLFFLREPKGGSTSAVRSGKEPLIAQEEEEKSLIWGPRRCSSLQPHAELISTRAKDRKEEMARRKRREVCWWDVNASGASFSHPPRLQPLISAQQPGWK